MAITPGDWTIDRATGDIRYIGDDHDGSPSYATVIQLHRWLQGLADDAVASGDDELDITNTNPSARSTDNIITLLNNYNINDVASEHLFDGSIIQDGGDTIYDGVVNFGNASVQIQVLQDGALIADDWWNQSGAGLNPDANQGISHRFMVKTRANGVDIDGRRLIGICRTFDNTYSEFKINGTSRGNNVLALTDSDDLNNETAIATVAGWTTITNTEGLRLIDVDNDGTDEEYYSEWNRDSYTINQLYERTKWLSKDPVTEDSCTDSGSNFVIDDATITGAAQSFTVGSNAMLITKITANLKIGAGTPTGNIIASIYTHNGTYGTSSVPNAQTGSSSDPYDSALLTSSYQEITFNFPTPVSVSASTYYCVVLEHADGAVGDYVHVEGLATSGTHSGNRAHNTAGWTAVAADDLAFTVYTAPSLYGMPGSQFRGPTHSFAYDGEAGGIAVSTNDMLAWGTLIDYGSETSGPFLVGEAVHEDTATPAWKGRILAVDDDGTDGYLVVDVESGTVTDTETFTGQSSGAGATVVGTPTAVSGGGVLHCLAVDDDGATGNLYVQLLKGTAPANDVRLYYCGTNLSTADATDYLDVNGSVTSRTVSPTFLGASTGSAIIGSYGVGVEYADLASTDKLFDLTNTQRTPPNLVTNIVGGMTTGDRVLVAPWDGTSYDTEGNPALDKDQLSLDTALTTDNITQVEITESIPSDTPDDGWIRVTDNNGLERRLHYQAWENGTPNRFYNIDTTDGNEDFASVNASVGNDIYIGYLDEEYDGTTNTDRYQAVHTAGSRDLVVVVRDGGGTPIKEFIQSWTFTSVGQTLTAQRITDA
jgi:hypothetical protein